MGSSGVASEHDKQLQRRLRRTVGPPRSSERPLPRAPPPPPPRLQHHPLRGRRKCLRRRSAGRLGGEASPPQAPKAFQCLHSYGLQPREVYHHLSDPPSAPVRPGGASAPRPMCPPPFQGFGADRAPLSASGSGQTRPSGPLTPRTQCSPQPGHSELECAWPSAPAPNGPGPAGAHLAGGGLGPAAAANGQLGGRRQAPRPRLPGPVATGDRRIGS